MPIILDRARPAVAEFSGSLAPSGRRLRVSLRVRKPWPGWPNVWYSPAGIYRRQENHMRVPPGVSVADFREAIQQFEAAVGKDWVFTSDEDVDLYRDAYS